MEVYRFVGGHRDRIVISAEDDGAYVVVFRRVPPDDVEYDHRLESVDGAKRYCQASWGVPIESWETSAEDISEATKAARHRRRKSDEDAWEIAREVGDEAAGCLRPFSLTLIMMTQLF